MMTKISLNSQNRYEIKVCGQVNDSWMGLFGDAKIHIETDTDKSQITTFSDVVMDQGRAGRPDPQVAWAWGCVDIHPADERNATGLRQTSKLMQPHIFPSKNHMLVWFLF